MSNRRFEMVWDCIALEMVDRSEYERRRGTRKQFKALPAKIKWVKRGLWKWDAAKGKLVACEQKPRLKWVAPAIQTDEIPETESMATADREIFTSKAKLMRHYKEHGFHVKESGECSKLPSKPKLDPKELREDLAKTLNDLRWGNIPLTDKEKELCKQEERATQEYKRRMGLK
jgi:hypothetical protein